MPTTAGPTCCATDATAAWSSSRTLMVCEDSDVVGVTSDLQVTTHTGEVQHLGEYHLGYAGTRRHGPLAAGRRPRPGRRSLEPAAGRGAARQPAPLQRAWRTGPRHRRE